MERWLAKVIAGVTMLVAIFVCFVTPIKLTGFFHRRGNKGQYYLDLLACFAGGVFLAAYLIFMAPSTRELIIDNLMRDRGINYPLPDMLIGIGFFLLLVINRTVVIASKISRNRREKKYRDSSDEKSGAMFSPSNGSSLPETDTMTTNSTNGVVMTVSPSDTKEAMVEVEEIDDEEIAIEIENVNSPYPLPRRSSITDVAHQDSTVRSIVMMLALSLDSFLEGITTGLMTTTVEVSDFSFLHLHLCMTTTFEFSDFCFFFYTAVGLFNFCLLKPLYDYYC